MKLKLTGAALCIALMLGVFFTALPPAWAKADSAPSVRIVTPTETDSIRGDCIVYAKTEESVSAYRIFIDSIKVFESARFEEVIKVNTVPFGAGAKTLRVEADTAGGTLYDSLEINLFNLQGEVLSYTEGASLMDYFTPDMTKALTDKGVKLTNKHPSEHWTATLGQPIQLDFSRTPRMVVNVTDFSDSFQFRLRGERANGALYEHVILSGEINDKTTAIGMHDIDLMQAMNNYKDIDNTQAFLSQIGLDSVQTVRYRPFVSAPQSLNLKANITLSGVGFYYPTDTPVPMPDDPTTLSTVVVLGNTVLSTQKSDWTAYRGALTQSGEDLTISENTAFNNGGALSTPFYADLSSPLSLLMTNKGFDGRYGVSVKINDNVVYTVAADLVNQGALVLDVKKRLAENYPDFNFGNGTDRHIVKMQLQLTAKGSDAFVTVGGVQLTAEAGHADNAVFGADDYIAPPQQGGGLPGWGIALISVGSVVVAGGAALAVVLTLKKRRRTTK